MQSHILTFLTVVAGIFLALYCACSPDSLAATLTPDPSRQFAAAMTYRAVRVNEFGGPENLKVEDLPALKPAAGQVGPL